jgi:hypothetical protein
MGILPMCGFQNTGRMPVPHFPAKLSALGVPPVLAQALASGRRSPHGRDAHAPLPSIAVCTFRRCSPLRICTLFFFALAVFAPLVSAQPGPESDAEAILQATRVNPLGNPITLNARLRNGNDSTPFQIRVDGTVTYSFENPEQAITLDLRGNDSKLTERSGKKTNPIRAARFDEAVRDTDISFEDLALKFLYWKNPKILGEETIRTRKTWKMELQAPRGQSQYGVARLWIDQAGGALMRVEGFDDNGRLIRRFEVISAQKIDDQWMLKQMRIETLDPDSKKTKSRTYLEVLGKADP